MAVETFYHGTSAVNASRIIEHGFDVEARKRSDPGDLGWGIYLTSEPARARAYGDNVLEVKLDTDNFARIKNPYFIDGLKPMPKPRGGPGRLFYEVAFDHDGEMITVKGKGRLAAARRVARAFLDAGYDGIIAGPFGRSGIEVVVFDPDEAVLDVKRMKKKAKPNIGTSWVNRILDKYWHELERQIGTGWLPVESEREDVKFVELGCGYYGCVLATATPGVVMKITTDPSEAAFVASALSLPDEDWPAGMIRYYEIYEIMETYKKRRTFMLWRQAAENVGGLVQFAGSARYEDRYGKRSLQEFRRDNRQWQATASKMRNQLTRVGDVKGYLKRVGAEADRAWNLYSNDRAFKLGPSLYGEPRTKMIAYGHKGPLAFELRRILLEQLAMEMANTHASSLIGEALGYYLEEGMLLADVHLGNIGEAVPEGYDDWQLVITDPGHMVPLDPKWLNVEIRML